LWLRSEFFGDNLHEEIGAISVRTGLFIKLDLLEKRGLKRTSITEDALTMT
jgi:hypothetical protein